MSILSTVKVNKRKYDSLGVYYRPGFFSQEEVELISNYVLSFKSEVGKHEAGFVKANHIDTAPEGYENKDLIRATFGKIKDAIKTIYSIENVYVNRMENIVISTEQSDGIGNQSFVAADPEKNEITVKKFMLPDQTQVDLGWCALIALSTDDFETGGEIKVIDGVVEKLNAGDVIWFKNDISDTYIVQGFEKLPNPEGGTSNHSTKSILDLTLTDLHDASRFVG